MIRLQTEKGEVSISDAALSNITGAAATSCFGVKGMAYRSMTDGLVHLLRREAMSKGVRIIPHEEGDISIELHIVVEHGVNIAAFTKEFNERTKNDMGLIIPVVITVYADRAFSFVTKTPPAAVLIKKECNIESGSGVPNKTKVATISKASVQKIAEMKMRDLNAGSLEAAMSMVAGTARSMGVVVGE